MSILQQICEEKRDHIRSKMSQFPVSYLEEIIQGKPATVGFRNRILFAKDSAKPFIIAEVKKASPSSGLIRDNFDAVEIAKTYEANGAGAISVLTDEPYFQGKDSYLADIRKQVSLPLLRKDFFIDPYQVYEARALGADCILLILSALSDMQAKELMTLAHKLDLDVIVEVHDRAELQRATALNANMIGINNRNLNTLEVNPNTALDLVGAIPEGVTRIAESGIKTRDDLMQFKNAGYEAFLIGESLMKQQDIGKALSELLS